MIESTPVQLGSTVPETTSETSSVSRRAALTRWPVVAMSVVIDIVLVNAAFLLAYFARYHWHITLFFRGRPTILIPYTSWTRFELLLTAITMVALGMAGVYRLRLSREWIDECWLIARSTTVAMALMIVFSSIIDPDSTHSRGVIVYTWFLLLVLLSLGKLLTQSILTRMHRTGWGVRRVLVAGATPAGRVIMQNLLRRRDRGYELVGFVQERGNGPVADFGRFKALGTVDMIGEVVRTHAINEVIIALPSASHSDIDGIRQHCEQQNVAFKLAPDLFELSLSRVELDGIAGIPLIDVRRASLRGFNLLLKRTLDIILSGTLLLLVSPLWAIIALAVRLDSPGRIILAQERVGRNGKTFRAYKFRSMYQDAEQRLAGLMALNEFHGPHFKLKNDPRRTRVGRIIRPLSLDELPQFWNVLKGDMSIVGPRPPLPREVNKYEPWHMKRLEAQPGITGLWQVSGRNSVPFDEMVVMDCYYIDNWSIGLDIRIMLQTVLAVVTMNGAS